MLILVLGPNKSGKSVFSERIFNTIKTSKCYIATLPSLRIYRNKIWEHQKRRPKSWGLVELTGDFEYDGLQLEHQIEYRQGLLLDGLSIYIEQIFPLRESSPLIWCKEVMNWINETFIRLNGTTIIVDCYPNLVLPHQLHICIKKIHEYLIKKAQEIYFVNNGKANLVKKVYENLHGGF
jgi:adenosyl cobinamide kinase/adenosyl cobinamide phosphate guanylyltransferase